MRRGDSGGESLSLRIERRNCINVASSVNARVAIGLKGKRVNVLKDVEGMDTRSYRGWSLN